MIIKASQRKGGRALGKHLMNTNDNDHVEIGDSRGFWGKSIYDCFLEIEAIASGTKCEQPLFSVSFNPPEGKNVTNAQFYNAFDRLEELLGLKGQPRFPVFHEKNGRRHAHCVWSRIDIDKMKAVNMAFFKEKCTRLSKELFIENNWKLPKGLINRKAKSSFSIAVREFQQLIKKSIHPNTIKLSCKAAWANSTDYDSLARKLKEHGLHLARGDRRGCVVIDSKRNIYSLSRFGGISTKEIKVRIGDSNKLPSVKAVNSSLRNSFNSEVKQKIADFKLSQLEERKPIELEKEALIKRQINERKTLDEKHRVQLRKRSTKAKGLYRKGLRGIFDKVTGRYERIRKIEKKSLNSLEQQYRIRKQQMVFEHIREQRKIYEILNSIQVSQQVERSKLVTTLVNLRR